MIQRSAFGGRIEIIANFRNEPFTHGAAAIPARSVWAQWIDTGRMVVYTPPPDDTGAAPDR